MTGLSNIEDDIAGYKCNLCGIIVKELKQFEEHKILHSNAKSSQCNLCLKMLRGPVQINLHKKVKYSCIFGINWISFLSKNWWNKYHSSYFSKYTETAIIGAHFAAAVINYHRNFSDTWQSLMGCNGVNGIFRINVYFLKRAIEFNSLYVTFKKLHLLN